jgi:UDP:flavonoid glycosyltransferase YjiC (YdhE family)
VERGNEVIYFSFPEFKEKILSTGAQYREYRNCPKLIANEKLMKRLSYLYSFIIYATYQILDDLIEDIKDINPDLIIYDGLCFWGKCVCQVLNIPSVSSISTCLFTAQSINWKLIIKELRKLRVQDIKYILQANAFQNKITKKYHLPKHKIINNFINISDLNIVYTSRAFQPLEKKFSNKHFKFV